MKKLSLISLSILWLFSCSEHEVLENDSETVVTQEFVLKTVRDTVIVGSGGTKISIKKGCFNTENNVKLVLKEYYVMSDMILDGLSTKCNNKLLETSGMIYLEAKDVSSGKEVSIVDDSKFLIEMPQSTTKGYNDLFYGEIKNGRLNWVQDSSSLNRERIPLMAVGINKFGDMVYSSAESNYPIIFNLSQLGWVNADKFIDFNNGEELLVDIGTMSKTATYQLVFENYNSLITGYFNKKGQLTFGLIPKGEKVFVIGFDIVDKKYSYSITKIEGATPKVNEFETASIEKIRKDLVGLFGKKV